MKVHGRILGTLNVGAYRVDAIPSGQRALLEVLAARLAAALWSLETIADLTRSRERLQQECDLQKSALQKSGEALEIQVAQRTEEIRRLQKRLQAENLYLKQELAVTHAYGEIIGESPSLKSVVSRIDLVAPTDASVLVSGESGTGKELVAREIHRHSRRRRHPLIKVNCATIPMELYESEFFGHVKGAFTGAISDRIGRFEAADGGSLFLDEVAEIPIGLQGKLLRVLQEGEFERVGEGRTRRVDVRIIAATNKNLAEEIRHGRFREDLYYRLNVFPIDITPLRDRREDIAALAYHFLAKLAGRMNRPVPPLSQANLADLCAHDWPGNARELQNVIERALILSPPDRLNLDLPRINGGVAAIAQAAAEHAPAPARPVMTEAEIKELTRRNMLAALARAGWKIYGNDGAARLLGLKPTTLIERMRAMGVRKPRQP
jgi:transcriptional regulator with GAF, ATPase, and Fis domain